MATTIPTTPTIPTTTTNSTDINSIGRKALEKAPASLGRLIAAINPSFSTFSGKTKGIGPQPSAADPIAGVVPGSPNQVLVTDTNRFMQDPQQNAVHEFVHLVQNNLTPEQKAQIPPDTGKPTIVTDPNYLAKQRKAGKTILQLPVEQQSYLTQFYQSKQEAFDKGYISKKEMAEVEKTYGPWMDDWNKVDLSNIKQTDPDSSTINTTPRAPLPPVNLQQSNVQFDSTSTSTVPVTDTNSSGTDPALAKLATPVDWMKKGHSYAKDAGAEKPVTSPRPSRQQTQPTTKPAAKTGEHHFAPTNLEDEKTGEEQNIPRDYRQQLIKSRIASVENPANKNPFNFTHPLDRQAATYAKAERIIKNPRFAALPSDQKTHVLDNYYDKYVVPIYKNSKIEPPPKDLWVGQVQKGSFKTSDFYEYSEATNKDAFSDFQAGVAHTEASAIQLNGHLVHSIFMAGIKVDRKILGVANFFPGSALHTWATERSDNDARVADAALKLSQDVIDRQTFWLDTHPTKSYTEKAGSFVGEAVVQLPLYEAINGPLEVLGATGEALLGAGKAVESTGTIGKAANFTRRLAASKTGQFAGRRLKEAASAYIGDIFSETPQGDRAGDMLAFMGLGAAGEGLGTLVKPISRAAMKRVAANNIAVGGKVFHETVADQAAFEIEHDIVGTDAAGNPIVHTDEHKSHPEQDKIYAAQMEAAHQADPVKHAAVTAEKISQNAMARQLYGKPLNQLSQLQRRRVRINMAKMATEATTEMPIHVPDVAQHEVTTKLSEDVKVNPQLAQTFQTLEQKYGAKIVDAVIKEEQDSIAVENGVKSTQGATERVGRNEKVLADKNAELGANGAVKNSQKSVEKSKNPIEAHEVHENLPKSYVSFKKTAVANFTNPFTSAATRQKQSLQKFLDGMDDADFIQEIGDQMGNQIKFEKSHDMLLWGLHHSESIPSPVVNKIKKILHDVDPNGTIAEWKDEAKRLSAHIDMLAMSGRLDTEGNVFRSTISTSFVGRTRWQREAEKEAALAEVQNYKTTMGPYKKNFADEYDEGLKQLAKLQSLRKNSKTDEDFFKAHAKIKKILEDSEGRK